MQWKTLLKYLAATIAVIVILGTIFVLLEILIGRETHRVLTNLNTAENIMFCVATMCVFVHLGYRHVNKPFHVSAAIGFILWLLLAIFIIHVLHREYENYLSDLLWIMLIALGGTAIGRVVHQQILFYKR